MRVLRIACLAAIVPVLTAQTSDVHAVLTGARQQMELTDISASGHLIWVQPGGARISYPITIKARWFPGVLRVKAEMGSASKPVSNSPAAAPKATQVLIEMRPGGQNAIWIAHSGDRSASVLPFEKWNEGPLGPTFGYEDFLEQQIFWPGQTLVEKTKFGSRDCDVIQSTPGPGDKTHYAQVKTWFDPTINFPVYAEKTVKTSGTVKEFTYYGLRREGGLWAARQLEMKNRGQAGSTLLVFDRGNSKANLTLNDFNPEQLTHF
jgi:hypothetical protein